MTSLAYLFELKAKSLPRSYASNSDQVNDESPGTVCMHPFLQSYDNASSCDHRWTTSLLHYCSVIISSLDMCDIHSLRSVWAHGVKSVLQCYRSEVVDFHRRDL